MLSPGPYKINATPISWDSIVLDRNKSEVIVLVEMALIFLIARK
jgi:hypothetical protein